MTAGDVLLLRLEGTLIAFGGDAVDKLGVVRTFPAASMLTGLLGNALGYRHADSDRLQRLQERLRFASRIDRPGSFLSDYQTVDLTQPSMVDTGWTTWGRRQDREGGEVATHQRERHYRADSVCTVALTLEPMDELPDLNQLEHALDFPARPLFLGRKCCLPSTPIRLCRMQAESLLEALRRQPLGRASDESSGRVPVQWPDGGEGDSGGRLVLVTDERDWLNQIHSGERPVREGVLEVEVEKHD